MLEAPVEKHLKRGVERLGGKAFKFIVPGFAGMPDRICFLPTAILLLVELKRPKGGRLSIVQRVVHRWFAKLGFTVHVCSTKEEVDALLQETERRITSAHSG